MVWRPSSAAHQLGVLSERHAECRYALRSVDPPRRHRAPAATASLPAVHRSCSSAADSAAVLGLSRPGRRGSSPGQRALKAPLSVRRAALFQSRPSGCPRPERCGCTRDTFGRVLSRQSSSDPAGCSGGFFDFEATLRANRLRRQSSGSMSPLSRRQNRSHALPR